MSSEHPIYNRHRFVIFLAIFTVALSSLFAFYVYDRLYHAQLAEEMVEETVRRQTINIMNKMREHDIVALPLTAVQEALLSDMSAVLGYPFAFEDEQGNVWHNDMAKSEGKEIRVPYIAQGELIGYVTTTLKMDGVVPRERRYQMGSVLFVIFIALTCFWLAKRLSKPLKQLSDKTEQIAQGDRVPNVKIEGTQELKQIAQTINALLSELNTHEALRQSLMQDLAHELRTPLTSILTIIEAMLDGIYPADEVRLFEIYEEMERLSRLIMDMVKLSEAESSRFSLKIERCDMTRLLKGVYQNFIPNANDKEIQLVFEPPTIPSYAEVDNDRVIQMMYNLLSNAINYTEPYGKVVLSLDSNEDEVIIRCQDSGIGIEEEQLSLIFSRLYRIDKSRSRQSGGLGVGLSITKALVEAHSGSISVESIVNDGSTFTIKLPKKYNLN